MTDALMIAFAEFHLERKLFLAANVFDIVGIWVCGRVGGQYTNVFDHSWRVVSPPGGSRFG